MILLEDTQFSLLSFLGICLVLRSSYIPRTLQLVSVLLRTLFKLHQSNKAVIKLERVTELPIRIFLVLSHVEDRNHVPVCHKHEH